jgi:hypothetical protein
MDTSNFLWIPGWLVIMGTVLFFVILVLGARVIEKLTGKSLT